GTSHAAGDGNAAAAGRGGAGPALGRVRALRPRTVGDWLGCSRHAGPAGAAGKKARPARMVPRGFASILVTSSCRSAAPTDHAAGVSGGPADGKSVVQGEAVLELPGALRPRSGLTRPALRPCAYGRSGRNRLRAGEFTRCGRCFRLPVARIVTDFS